MPFDALPKAETECFYWKSLREAAEAIVMLDLLEELLAFGRNWTVCVEWDTRGRYCLLGGIGALSKRVGMTRDGALRYLSAALGETVPNPGAIAMFNDSCAYYEEVTPIIRQARRLAQLALYDTKHGCCSV